MTQYTHLIWDFNGTILDDVQLCMDCVNRMLADRHLKVIPSAEAYRNIFGFPIDAYYQSLGFDFEKEDYETVLAPEWVSYYLADECHCPLYPGVEETVHALHDRGIPQIVLSATKLSQLENQLKRLGVRDSFDEVIGLDNIHARSKMAQACAWKEAHPEARPLFVGDTEHDAEVAARVGADCVLFTGGHQSAERLSALRLPMIADIREILAYFA